MRRTERRTRGGRGRRVALSLGLATLLLGGPASVDAQILWEAPRQLGTDVPRGLGVHLARFGALPGDGRGLLVTWTGGLPDGIRLRGGWGEGAGGEDAFHGGIDVWRRLTSATERSPVDLVWTTGVGGSSGEWTLVSVPVGIAAGTAWTGGPVWLSPWVHAGVVFDWRTGDEAPEDEFEVGIATELGLHLSFDRGRRVVVSAGAGLGDRQALVIGLVLRP